MFTEMIESELQKYSDKPDIVKGVRACMNHVKCLCCMDTGRILFTSESYFGGTYEEFTCPPCNHGQRRRMDSHHNIRHCMVNGTQVPYNGGDSSAGYSRIAEMYNLYKNRYEQTDLATAAAKPKPLWESVANKSIEREMKSVDVKVDIAGLVGDITGLLNLTAGNITGLIPFLKSLDASLNFYWSHETGKNSIFKKMKDDKDENVYVKFEYMKVVKETKGNFMRFKGATSTSYLNISYFIVKPLNDAAEAQCDDLMNNTIQDVISKLRK